MKRILAVLSVMVMASAAMAGMDVNPIVNPDGSGGWLVLSATFGQTSHGSHADIQYETQDGSGGGGGQPTSLMADLYSGATNHWLATSLTTLAGIVAPIIANNPSFIGLGGSSSTASATPPANTDALTIKGNSNTFVDNTPGSVPLTYTVTGDNNTIVHGQTTPTAAIVQRHVAPHLPPKGK